MEYRERINGFFDNLLRYWPLILVFVIAPGTTAAGFALSWALGADEQLKKIPKIEETLAAQQQTQQEIVDHLKNKDAVEKERERIADCIDTKVRKPEDCARPR